MIVQWQVQWMLNVDEEETNFSAIDDSAHKQKTFQLLLSTVIA